MLLRLLFILIAFVILLRLLGWRPPRERRSQVAVEDPTLSASSTDLVRCARCAVHLPRSLALERQSQWYCSPEHRDAS